MPCINNSCNNCGSDFSVKTIGTCNVSNLTINGSDRSSLNWTEISVPEILTIPELKPDIENIDQVFANVKINNGKLIETPFAYKSYSLYFLPADLLAEIVQIVTGLSMGALVTAIGAVTTVLDNIATILAGLPELAIINELLDDIEAALNAVNAAMVNLQNIILIPNPPANLLCSAIQTLIDALNILLGLINSVIPTINDILELVTPAIAALIAAAITGLQALINTAVSAINALLLPLLGIDCDPGSAFELIPNAEGTCLSGRKLIIDGQINQKIVYTAEVESQSVHSAHYEFPFLAFIIPYPKFEGLTYQEGIVVYDPETDSSKVINGYIYDPAIGINVDLCEDFVIEKCIEDIFVYALDKRTIFKNVTLFLKATVSGVCN
ncbi:hypothetical protein [Paraclostridium sordellii]|uniref:hypothetical protein n=1 Tax=Paraclostridium sordellii TaxID=1505 RepID=UPI0022E5787B|nr:hypothetical protein [Paeniclostridium sordellii]